MLTWFIENLSTIVVGGLVSCVVAAIAVSMIRNKKKGKTACGCGCGSCPMSGDCNSKK